MIEKSKIAYIFFFSIHSIKDQKRQCKGLKYLVMKRISGIYCAKVVTVHAWFPEKQY